MNLSPHFTLAEATHSGTAIRLGIDNQPTLEVVENMKIAAERMETVREILGGHPIEVTSWYRSLAVEKRIGGSMRPNGHSSGFCIDFRMYNHLPGYKTPLEVCEALMLTDLKWDQLIWEGTWVHISFHPGMRQMKLTAHFGNGPATYTSGIPS